MSWHEIQYCRLAEYRVLARGVPGTSSRSTGGQKFTKLRKIIKHAILIFNIKLSRKFRLSINILIYTGFHSHQKVQHTVIFVWVHLTGTFDCVPCMHEFMTPDSRVGQALGHAILELPLQAPVDSDPVWRTPARAASQPSIGSQL